MLNIVNHCYHCNARKCKSMCSVASKLWNYVSNFFENKPLRIMMLGLNDTGKTTILYKLKLNETVATYPTIGFNVDDIKLDIGISLSVWDAGGRWHLKTMYRCYFKNTHGLIFVSDSSDRLRFEEARKELFSLFNESALVGVPLVIIANKKDLPGAARSNEIIDVLHLNEINGRTWRIHETCATTGEGLSEAMCEMANLAKQFKRTHKRYCKPYHCLI